MILKEKIELNNNYYMEIVNNGEKLQNAIDVRRINIANTLRAKKIILKIDLKEINKKNYKRILKKLLFIRENIKKIGIEKDENTLIGYVLNYNEQNKAHKDFISAINAIFYPNRYERYNYIYDNVCNYLDSYFYGKNLCDFKNNKCGEKRNTDSDTGCCHHFKTKWLGPFSKLVLCEHLKKDYTCGAKCISCKLFTCDYLEKKGIKFRIKDILLLNVFFNPLQKYFIKYMVYTPKEKILKRLMFLDI